MTDLDTAVQKAKEAGFETSYLCKGYFFLAKPEQIKSLVTRAQNEVLSRYKRRTSGDSIRRRRRRV